jgi:hypothetical protein
MERYEGAGWIVAVLLLVALLAAIAEVGASRSVTSTETLRQQHHDGPAAPPVPSAEPAS